MNKPIQVNVLGKPYLINYASVLEMKGNLGTVERSKQIINIDSESQGEDQFNETLLHEIIHIIDGELILGLSEETVARLAVGLYSAGYGKLC